MIGISNTTPIISLCSVRAEYILKELFQQIIIPNAVYLELTKSKKTGCDFYKNNWVNVVKVKNRQSVNLLLKDIDLGESEVIVAALEIKHDALLIDEQIGYDIAKFYDLPVVRTLSLLKSAKELGIISSVRPIVEKMLLKGRWYSNALIKKFLKGLNE